MQSLILLLAPEDIGKHCPHQVYSLSGKARRGGRGGVFAHPLDRRTDPGVKDGLNLAPFSLDIALESLNPGKRAKSRRGSGFSTDRQGVKGNAADILTC